MGAPIRLTVNTGQVFGRLTVLDPDARGRSSASNPRGVRKVRCRCSCGQETVVFIRNLTSGMTQSCGCARAEVSRNLNRTHGLFGHALYSTWLNMRQRCENPRNTAYKDYGARGIRVCEPWRDLRNFVTWIEANLGPRPPGMTLDRIDNDDDYRPGNVKWSTRAEQQNNRRRIPAMELRLLMTGNNWPALVD